MGEIEGPGEAAPPARPADIIGSGDATETGLGEATLAFQTPPGNPWGSGGFRWKVGALTAGLVSTSGVCIYSLTSLQPMQNPGHFVVTVIAVFGLGFAMQAVVGHGRLSDAMKQKELYRLEVVRMAQNNKELVQLIVKQPLSSNPPPLASDKTKASPNNKQHQKKKK